MNLEQVYIGMGANLNEPLAQLINALKALSQLPQTELKTFSSLYSSTPLGPQDQPDYVNAVAHLSTTLLPEALLDALQKIEKEQGRQRKAERWGPRTLDLDILFFGQQVLDTERLTVPHYHFHEREFVIYPLLEISPEFVIPDGEPLSSLTSSVAKNGFMVIKPSTEIEIA